MLGSLLQKCSVCEDRSRLSCSCFLFVIYFLVGGSGKGGVRRLFFLSVTPFTFCDVGLLRHFFRNEGIPPAELVRSAGNVCGRRRGRTSGNVSLLPGGQCRRRPARRRPRRLGSACLGLDPIGRMRFQILAQPFANIRQQWVNCFNRFQR